MKQILVLFLTGCLSLGLLTACGAEASSEEAPLPEGTVSIQLSDNGITVDGEKASSDDTDAVYVAHDIVFYLEGQGIAYGEGAEEDAHSQAEADAHTVVHISQPGTYVLSGTLSAGQVAVDLREDAEEDPDAVVTLILNGVDITCSVAPAVIFYNVYECGSADAETAVKDVDTSAAGANVILADGTVNNIAGSYVARIYKPDSVELSEDGSEVVDSKKLHKYDGAFYSKMSMNVDGEAEGTGVLNIFAENEGLDSELHLTVNGGVINILSGNDGINTNEDGVSVTTVNGGTMTIEVDGATGEGDGIDSNGWLVINGGTVIAAACGDSQDAGIDSDMGIYINGGTVVASGNMYDRIEDGGQNYVVFSFAERQQGGTTYTLEDVGSMPVGTYTPANDFTYLVISDANMSAANYRLLQGETPLSGIVSDGEMGRGGMGGGPRPNGEAQPPEEAPDQERPQPGKDGMAVDPSGKDHPEDGVRPQRPEGFGGMPGAMQADGERVTAFAVTDGGNFITQVAPAEAET
ncbi:carbohydrate-binding domain-containing protein [Dysosmobacter sp. Sow4_B12]|uniref:carbohydrate-binding domain-containing protein n=1 Tax=Dysosmobacter sp. Sow4_B12 TaxID=3438777 RepID=UPI003F91309E